jgi:Asp-tRNA(Asn)/Glu-tRNA(Gln) amidotransferase A subunit family amidase
MSKSDLNFISAAQAAALIRTKKLSPVEYLEAILDSVAELQPSLNAFVTLAEDEARQSARRAEQAVLNGDDLGPLHGVPVHIKDLFTTKGLRTTMGSAIYADFVPDRSDVLVERLEAAGAIVMGKTTTPEFGHKGMTDGPSFGVTSNPWNLERTPGGSSGGAAAAVAAGLGPLGLGTDGAGSIRIPAACCGIVGLKPTTGALPYEQAVDAFVNYAAAGPLSRTVTDAALMTAVMRGPHPSDPYSLAAPPAGRISPDLAGNDLHRIRIGYIPRMANPKVAADVERNTLAALDVLTARGAEVEIVEEAIDWIEHAGRIMYYANMTVAFGRHLEKWAGRMDPVLLAFIERGSAFTLQDFRSAQYARTKLFRSVQKLFDRYDFLVSPTLTRTALAANFDVANDQVEVDGEACGITRLGWTAYVYPFNLTGHPAISVPSGFGNDGLPTSVQIIGRWWADDDVMRLAAILEEDSPWAAHIPPVSGRKTSSE